MYCIKCGVKLADTEKKCPLCGTVVYHPDFEQPKKPPIYPENKMPKTNSTTKAINDIIMIMFIIPLLVCFFADLKLNGKIEWFGYVAGALAVFYISLALPLWFKKPNPVIFIPCDFIAIAIYLLYINFATNGNWFITFALPLIGGLCLITDTVIVLLYYLKKGILYILGGAFIAFGAFMLLIEFLSVVTFEFDFIGWSLYPLFALFMLGGLLIYLAINSSARELIKQKMFF